MGDEAFVDVYARSDRVGGVRLVPGGTSIEALERAFRVGAALVVSAHGSLFQLTVQAFVQVCANSWK